MWSLGCVCPALTVEPDPQLAASPVVRVKVRPLPKDTAEAVGSAEREGRDLSYQMPPYV